MSRLTRSLLNEGYVSLEGFPDVSVEEEVILAGESAQDVAEADATMDEVDRLQNVSEIVDNHVDYVDSQIPEATQNEVALSEQVADLATVGTGESSETVMPAVESYIGSRISTEGLREMVRSFWEAIKRAIKKVWAIIKQYWRKMTSRLGSLVKSAKSLKQKVSDAGGKTAKEKKISLSGSTLSLISAASVAKKGSDMLANVKVMTDLADVAANKMAPAIQSVGEKIADNMGDFDDEKPEASLKKINNVVSIGISNAAKSGLKVSGSGDKRFFDKDHSLETTGELCGGKALFVKVPTMKSEDEDKALEVARCNQDTQFIFTNFSEKDRDIKEGEFEVMTLGECDKVAELVMDTAKELQKYTEGKGRTDLEKAADLIEKAGQKAAEKVSKLEGKDSDDGKAAHTKNVLTHLRAVQRYASFYTRVSKDPHLPLSNHCAAVMRAAITVAERSVSQYK